MTTARSGLETQMGAFDDLTLSVPVDNADGVGLRDVIDDEEMTGVYALLARKNARPHLSQLAAAIQEPRNRQAKFG